MSLTYKSVQAQLRAVGIVISKKGEVHNINFFGGLDPPPPLPFCRRNSEPHHFDGPIWSLRLCSVLTSRWHPFAPRRSRFVPAI